MAKKRDFSKDILVCVKRLHTAEKLIRKWMRSGGQIPFEYVHNSLCLDGYITNDKRVKIVAHPITEYSEHEKMVFKQCFGEPLSFPKKFVLNVSWKEILDKIIERRRFLKEAIAMTKSSQFRNYPQKKLKNNGRTKTRSVKDGKL